MTGGSDSIAFLHKYKKHFTDQLIFPTMSDERLFDIDNKWTFAVRLMSAGIPTPYTLLIDTINDVDTTKKGLIEEKIGFPLMVKPTMRDGGEGVEKIESFEALRKHVLDGGEYAQLPLIIQEFVDGFDINTGKLYVLECNPCFWRSVTAAMWQGLNFTEAAVNSSLGAPYSKFGAIGQYVMPGKKVKVMLKRPWRYFSLSKMGEERTLDVQVGRNRVKDIPITQETIHEINHINYSFRCGFTVINNFGNAGCR